GRREPHDRGGGRRPRARGADPAYAGGDDAEVRRPRRTTQLRSGHHRQACGASARGAFWRRGRCGRRGQGARCAAHSGRGVPAVLGLRGPPVKFDTIDAALADLKKGRAIVVVDDKNRENEGDVAFAASRSTPAKINFLARHARGLICVALSADRVDALGLRPMADRNGSRHETAFTISVEAREGTTTGISAADRSLTARALANESLD